MKATTTRRGLLEVGGILAGAWSISGPAAAQTRSSAGTRTEEIVRRYYKAWEGKDWSPLDALLAENFTFTSANDDDHISKTAYKSGCWDTQNKFIDHFDIELLFSRGDEALVKYLCHTTNGKSFRNIEYVRIQRDKVEAVECYFGEHSSFPTAVSLGKK